jgi:hypothetical protein
VSVSLAGFIVWEVNVREGRDRAAAHTLEVEDAVAFVVLVDEVGEVGVPWACLGACR